MSLERVSRLLLSFQRTDLYTSMGHISVHLDPQNNKVEDSNTVLFTKNKSLPVMNKTITNGLIQNRETLT